MALYDSKNSLKVTHNKGEARETYDKDGKKVSTEIPYRKPSKPR